MDALTDFEAAVPKYLLAGDEPNLDILRNQLTQASVSRGWPGTGCLIDSHAPETCSTAPTTSRHLGDVAAARALSAAVDLSECRSLERITWVCTTGLPQQGNA